VRNHQSGYRTGLPGRQSHATGSDYLRARPICRLQVPQTGWFLSTHCHNPHRQDPLAQACRSRNGLDAGVPFREGDVTLPSRLTICARPLQVPRPHSHVMISALAQSLAPLATTFLSIGSRITPVTCPLKGCFFPAYNGYSAPAALVIVLGGLKSHPVISSRRSCRRIPGHYLCTPLDWMQRHSCPGPLAVLVLFRRGPGPFSCSFLPSRMPPRAGSHAPALAGPVQWLDDRVAREILDRRARFAASCGPAPCPACCRHYYRHCARRCAGGSRPVSPSTLLGAGWRSCFSCWKALSVRQTECRLSQSRRARLCAHGDFALGCTANLLIKTAASAAQD